MPADCHSGLKKLFSELLLDVQGDTAVVQGRMTHEQEESQRNR